MTQFKIKVLDIESLPRFQKLPECDKGRLMEFDQDARHQLTRIVAEILDRKSYLPTAPQSQEMHNQLEGVLHWILSCPNALAINHLQALHDVLFSTCAIHLGPFYFMYDVTADHIQARIRRLLFQYDSIEKDTGFGY